MFTITSDDAANVLHSSRHGYSIIGSSLDLLGHFGESLGSFVHGPILVVACLRSDQDGEDDGDEENCLHDLS